MECGALEERALEDGLHLILATIALSGEATLEIEPTTTFIELIESDALLAFSAEIHLRSLG